MENRFNHEGRVEKWGSNWENLKWKITEFQNSTIYMVGLSIRNADYHSKR